MKNLNKYKTILLLSLMPYTAVLGIFILVAITGYGYNLGNKAYGIVAVGNWLGDCGEYWFEPNIRHIIIFLCITYQITYLLKLRDLLPQSSMLYETEAIFLEREVEPKEKKKSSKVKRFFLWLSFIPYIIIIVCAIFHGIFGVNKFALFSSGNTIYGIEAFYQTIVFGVLILVVIIPILPICLIYQIVCLIIKIIEKKADKTLRRDKNSFVGPIENTKANKVILIFIFAITGIICLWLAGFFSIQSDDPYISSNKVKHMADYKFNYSNMYSEQNLIPEGATRYIVLSEMRIYWEKDNDFGYNGLKEIDDIYKGRNNEYIIVLMWEGEGSVKMVYAIADPQYPNNILDIYVELDDGRLLIRDNTFNRG